MEREQVRDILCSSRLRSLPTDPFPTPFFPEAPPPVISRAACRACLAPGCGAWGAPGPGPPPPTLTTTEPSAFRVPLAATWGELGSRDPQARAETAAGGFSALLGAGLVLVLGCFLEVEVA